MTEREAEIQMISQEKERTDGRTFPQRLGNRKLSCHAVECAHRKKEEEGNRAIQRDRLINNSNLFFFFFTSCVIFSFSHPLSTVVPGHSVKICIFIFSWPR